MAAEETSRRLEEQVQGLQAQLRGDYVVQAEELREPGYTGDAADQVVILDMALGFSRVRVKTAERELKETRAKLKAAETEKLQWRKRGEEAEAKLRIRVGEGEARMVGAVEIATVQAEVEEARDETEEWKGRAEEVEAQLELGECERGREREEFKGTVSVIEAELAKMDALEEEVAKWKKEAGKEANGAAKACQRLASVAVEKQGLELGLSEATQQRFREGFEEGLRSASAAADYRPGQVAGRRAPLNRVRAPHAVDDQW